MPITRRALGALLACACLPGCATAAPADGGPLLYVLERGAAKVFILGHAEADDRSWFTPRIERAIRSAQELWLETPPPGAPPSTPALVEQLGYDRSGSLFTFLGPELAPRVLALAAKVGVTRERLEPMRPWLAHYVLTSARMASRPQAPSPEGPPQTLIAVARERNIPIRAEYPTGDDLIRFFAAMPDEAQRQYLRNLLDYVDADDKGLTRSTSWARGKPNVEWAQRMHDDTPALYRLMHTERNRAWARRIDGLLDQGGTRFVLLGQNHTVGPDSVLAELRRLGLRPRLADA